MAQCITHFLRFDDQAEADAALSASGYLDEGSGVPVRRVGRVEATPAVCDDNGDIVTRATYVDGYHVNVGLQPGDTLPEALAAYEVTPTPATPAHAFCGDRRF